MFESIWLLHKLLALLFVLHQSEGTKWLLDSPGFDSPDSWISQYLPCSLEDVVFPEKYPAVLPLPKSVDIRGIVLPKDGALLLEQESTISLGGELKGRDCENGKSRRAHLKPPTVRKWFSPSSWRAAPDIAQNAAIPEMERVPCNNESVVIRRGGPLAIDLENVPSLRLGQLSLAGSLISKDYLEYLFTTDLGQMLFKNALTSSVEYYRTDVCGCHNDFSSFLEPVCHNVVPTCKKPHCLAPITPYESCCPVCGSVMKITVDRCDDGNLHKLRQTILKAMKEQDLVDELDLHVHFVHSEQYGKFLQAIVVDRNAYSQRSVNFISKLNATVDWEKLLGSSHRLELQFSGRPHNPNVTVGSIVLMVVCLMFVAFVGLVIFSHYAPDNRYLRRIPQWIHEPRRWRNYLLRSPFIFARFDNSAAGEGAAEEVHENIIMGYDAESGEVRERAFDNPMFDEKTRQTITESKKKKPEPELETEASPERALEDVGIDRDGAKAGEEQELTEIKLESSSSSSDDDSEPEPN